MGFWGALLGVPPEHEPGSSGSAASELFDDEFQRKLETLAIVSRKVWAAQNRAQRRTKKRGSGVEFADHRDYTAGDDFRFVDWALYRRFGRLLVRLFEEEEDLSIYFLIDCSKSMAFGAQHKFDQARRLCAALAYVGLANLDRITIVGVGDNVEARLPPARGKGQIFKIFRFLRNLEPTSNTDLEQALRTFVAQHPRRGLAVLISDLFDPQGFERGLNMLRYNKFEPFLLHLTDAADRAIPRLGDLQLEDCETRESREVTVTAELEAKLQSAFSDYQSAIEAFCAKSHIAYFQADVYAPFDQLVLRVFREGGFLR
jgi:uncharacterized protein (DUF58 family)